METMTMYRADQEIMKRFVWRRVYPDEKTIVLAQGGDGEGPVWAHIVPLGDDPRVGIDLEVTTNVPEYVTLREIYDYYRRQDMTWAELKEPITNDIAASRYKELVARGTQLFAEHSGLAPCQVEGNRAHVQVDVEGETLEGDGTLLPCYSSEFRLIGDIWHLRFLTEEGYFPNHEGFRYIAQLLAHPEKSIEAIELYGLQDTPADYR